MCEELGRELPELGGEGISKGPKIRKRCGGGGEVGGVCSSTRQKAVLGGKAVRGEGQSCCAGCFSLMSCATCTPSIAEQVSTRLTVGFILLENSVP